MSYEYDVVTLTIDVAKIAIDQLQYLEAQSGGRAPEPFTYTSECAINGKAWRSLMRYVRGPTARRSPFDSAIREVDRAMRKLRLALAADRLSRPGARRFALLALRKTELLRRRATSAHGGSR